MNGKFTGAGVGPGDPELMTYKAVRAVRECDVIAVPVSDSSLTLPVFEQAEGADGKDEKYTDYLNGCVAYQIAVRACPEAAVKDRIYLPMPMIRDKEKLKKIHDRDAKEIADLLNKGKNVVFLTLGDPTVYSTCMYIHKRLKRSGYPTEIVPGIPSFCAAAACLDLPLVENRQELHILPASYDIGTGLDLPGTKVLMKTGRKLNEVRNLLIEKELDAVMVENCGMPDEKCYYGVEEIPEKSGYYSLLIVKDRKRNKTETDQGGKNA